jgi:hypothetical protein
MSRPKLKRPSSGTVLGLLALIVAVAGNTGAFAGTTHVIVRKGDIAKGAVTANALAKGAVTAKTLRKGAVGPAALADDSVSPTALKAGAVTPAALAPNAVTASAIAPGSVYGAALGSVVVHSTSIADLDEVEENGTWTASNTENATCGPGERLLSGGIVFSNPGNREVGVLESLPFDTGSLSGVVGRITSNSGGFAAAEVRAICLK